MLTIVTALPWEAAPFAARLRGRRRTDLGATLDASPPTAGSAWALRGSRGTVQVRVIVSGPGEERAEAVAALLPTLDPPAGGILVTGVAGGLDPALKPGALVLATRIQQRRARGGRRGSAIPATPRFRDWLRDSLRTAGLEPVSGEVLSRDAILRSAAEKAEAHEQSRAIAVQIEDYVWAQQATEAGLPFASLRAVLDPATSTLPREILDWNPAGPSAATIAAAIARRPPLALALVRLGRQRRAAVRAIDRALEAIVQAGGPDPGADQSQPRPPRAPQS